jgi:hypothetical protein
VPYRAQLGGFLGGGTPAPQPQRLDVGGLVDAVTGGAQGLIHQAYTRRMQEHEIARQDAQLQLERQRDERQSEHERRMSMASGIVPGETHVELAPPAAPPQAAMPSIRDAFDRADLGAGTSPAAAPSALQTPVTEGSLGSIPRVRVTSTPEHYDPQYDRVYTRTMNAIGARGTEARQTEEVKQGGRVDRDAARHTFKLEEQADKATADAERSAAHDGRVGTASAAHDGRVAARVGATGARTLTANAKEAIKSKLLDGLVGYHGDESKLRDYLTNDDVGKGTIDKYGITESDITAALGRSKNHVTDQVVRAAGTGSPERAAQRVRAARAAASTPAAPAVNAGAARAAPPAAAGAPPAAAGASHAITLPPLSPAEIARANTDPKFKAFAQSKGYKF